MTPDDEQRIERYLQRPSALSDEARRRVEALLDRDEAVRAYAEILSSFYDLLGEERRRAPAPKVDAFVDDLFDDESPPAVVPVHPVRPTQSSRPTVLAAATAEAAHDRRFSVLTTLAAEEEGVLVRIIGDRKTDQGRLYVLADTPRQQPHVIVSFPGFGLDLVTDAEGRRAFDLPSHVGPEQWREATAAVRRPVAAGRIQPDRTLTLGTEAGARVRCRRTGGALTVTLQAAGAGGNPSLLTMAPMGEEEEDRTLLRLSEDEPIRHDCRTDGELMLRIYE